MAEAKPKAQAEDAGGGDIQDSEGTVVQSTTEATPADADKSSLPNAMDAEGEQPPVRTQHPDTPIAQTLAAGAGEHTPPDPEKFDPEGRPRDEGA